MSKAKNPLVINLNLLKPQGNPEKIMVNFIHWLLSSGRYIFVFVEALVLIAFIARFKLDADLAAKKEAIEEQIPYIESLKPYEILIRQTQLKLATTDSTKKASFDWTGALKKIADQTPVNTKVVSINIAQNINIATIRISGQTQTSGDLTSFVNGLKEDKFFYDVNLASVGLEETIVKFTINASAKSGNGGNNL